MKERGMLFAGDMVRAILHGAKTQTRRPISQQPPRWNWSTVQTSPGSVNVSLNDGREYFVKPPHGKPGDVIYVRETYQRVDTLDGFGVIYRADGAVLEIGCHDALPIDQLTVPHVRLDDDLFDGPWVPSIHMPKGLSRIRLPITNVRVERIQEISEEDARAEGIERVGGEYSCAPWKNYSLKPGDPFAKNCSSPIRSFDALWSAIYPGSWERNDWVWVYEWDKIEVMP